MYRTSLAIFRLACLALFCAVPLLCGCDPSSTSVPPGGNHIASVGDNDPATATLPHDVIPPVEQIEPEKIVFDDLKFDIEWGDPFEREMLTDEIKAFVGRPITLKGFMLGTAQRDGIKRFILIRDNQECCFGPGAAVYHCVQAAMEEGHEAEYTARPVTITGKFSIEPFIGPDGHFWAVYAMTDCRMVDSK